MKTNTDWRPNLQPDTGPNDEERGQTRVPMRASLPRSSSSVSFALGITTHGMIAQQIKNWWAAIPLMIALSVNAQSDLPDKSPHKTGFITVNKVKLHYLDWAARERPFCFSMA